jgi:DNA-binding transcriptional MerR regulator/methylmalonyl-CoA mutase cobalamin-binding subunit
VASDKKRPVRPPGAKQARRANPALEAPQLHPIQVVARRTGLSLDLLRAWEKRYAAVTPARTRGGRRIYSDRDVERLRWLKRAVDGGRSIGQVAALETGALRRLIEADEVAESAPGATRATRPGGSGGTASRSVAATETLDACLAAALDAVERLDARGLEDALARAAIAGPHPALFERLLVPLMRTIGSRWHDGTLRIAQEHLATSAVRSFVGALGASRLAAETGPELVAATPSGQQHELGVLVAGAAAAEDGWRVTYLGPNLPAEEIAAAARGRAARAVLLGLAYPPDDGRLVEQLRQLRRLLPEEIEVLTGGDASDSYAAVLDALGFARVRDLTALRRALEAIRRRPSPA